MAYDHNYFLGSAVYEALRAFHPDFSRELHRSSTRAKLALSEVYHVAQRRGEASFRMASPDERLLRLASGALTATGKLDLGGSIYVVTGTEAHLSPEPLAPMGVHTLSPILIRAREGNQSLVHDNCDYPKVLSDVINHDVKRAAGREGSIRVLRMEKLEVRKRRLAERTVLAQKGTFWLDGDAADIAHVFDWGIGHSTGLGFGLVVPEGHA